MKLDALIKMSLNETYSEVQPHEYSTQKGGLKQGAISFQLCFRKSH
jgi:hypothetical protein